MKGDDRNVVSPGNYLDWREQATSFEELGAHTDSFGMALTGSGGPTGVTVARLTSSALRALGVEPAAGRVYDTREFGPSSGNGPEVALLSHAFWVERFGGDPGAIGQLIHLNDRPHVILGVMPETFSFPSAAVQAWLPATFDADDRNERRSHNWGVVARLKPDASREAAEAEMKAIAATAARHHPQFMTGWSVNVVPLHEDLVGDVRPLLLMLACLALAALGAAAANLASLLLARARRREPELTEAGQLVVDLLADPRGPGEAWDRSRLARAFPAGGRLAHRFEPAAAVVPHRGRALRRQCGPAPVRDAAGRRLRPAGAGALPRWRVRGRQLLGRRARARDWRATGSRCAAAGDPPAGAEGRPWPPPSPGW